MQTLGNHEFDFGPVSAYTYLSQLKFPVLGACNVNASADPTLNSIIQKWTIVTVPKTSITVRLGSR
jgi:2',3'-cyclic-nucleotide 2'-phosphodiesterase (5'-nucleotidase family)